MVVFDWLFQDRGQYSVGDAEEFAQAIGADAYCRDAAVAVETAKTLIAARRAAMH